MIRLNSKEIYVATTLNVGPVYMIFFTSPVGPGSERRGGVE